MSSLPSALLTAEEWSALRLSFQVAVCAATAGLPIAILIGYWLARSRSRSKWLLEVVVNVPLVLPPVVTGYLLLICFSPRGPVGSLLADWFGVRIVFTWVGAALAAAVVSFPLMVRAIRLAFQQTDPRLESAAVAGNIGGQTRTIPLAVFSMANQPGGIDQAWRLVALSILLACVALAASGLLEARQLAQQK